ncbi:LysM peptidoglycan-binding domain-containing protein [Arthrobacter sp. Z1-9]
MTVTQRALDNTASFTTISWSLEEWVDVTTSAIRPRPVPKVPVVVQPVAAPVRTHRVVSGDTLGHIAQRYLGSGPRWPEIFALNTAIIKNPH